MVEVTDADPKKTVEGGYDEGGYVQEGYFLDPPNPVGDGSPAIVVDSSSWTGAQFVLVDVSKLTEVRCLARQLQDAVDRIAFESNSASANVKGLVSALIAICEMAEPEVSVIQRILASPNFKAYASLVTIIATIRGAIGF